MTRQAANLSESDASAARGALARRPHPPMAYAMGPSLSRSAVEGSLVALSG